MIRKLDKEGIRLLARYKCNSENLFEQIPKVDLSSIYMWGNTSDLRVENQVSVKRAPLIHQLMG